MRCLRTAVALTLLTLLTCVGVRAQPAGDGVSAERSRIAAERVRIEEASAREEKACYQRFAVNDCLNDTRERKREFVSDLRRQELALGDAERKRRSAQRQREIEQRDSPARQEAVARRREKSLDEARERQKRAADKTAEKVANRRPPVQAGSASRQVQPVESNDALVKANRSAEREQEAQRRKERAAERVAQRRRPPASSLPTPP